MRCRAVPTGPARAATCAGDAGVDVEAGAPVLVDDGIEVGGRGDGWIGTPLVGAQRRHRGADLVEARPTDGLGVGERPLGVGGVAAQDVAGAGDVEHDSRQRVAGEVVELTGDAPALLRHRLLGECLARPLQLADQGLLAVEQAPEDEGEDVGERPRLPADVLLGNDHGGDEPRHRRGDSGDPCSSQRRVDVGGDVEDHRDAEEPRRFEHRAHPGDDEDRDEDGEREHLDREAGEALLEDEGGDCGRQDQQVERRPRVGELGDRRDHDGADGEEPVLVATQLDVGQDVSGLFTAVCRPHRHEATTGCPARALAPRSDHRVPTLGGPPTRRSIRTEGGRARFSTPSTLCANSASRGGRGAGRRRDGSRRGGGAGSGAEGDETLGDATGARPLADTEGLGEDAHAQLLEQPAHLHGIVARARAPEAADVGVVAPFQRDDLAHPPHVAGDVVAEAVEAVGDAVDVAPDVGDALGAGGDHEVRRR